MLGAVKPSPVRNGRCPHARGRGQRSASSPCGQRGEHCADVLQAARQQHRNDGGTAAALLPAVNDIEGLAQGCSSAASLRHGPGSE